MIDPAALLEEANAYAQRRFRAMLDAKAYSNPDAPETKAYLLAERIVDEFLEQIQRPKQVEDFSGDHHVYPQGVGR